MCVCVCLSVVSQKDSDRRFLTGGKYDIDWDYGLCGDHYVGIVHVSGVHHGPI